MNFLSNVLCQENKIINDEACSTYYYPNKYYSSKPRVIKCIHSRNHQEVNTILEDIQLIKSSSSPHLVRIEDFTVQKDDFDGWRIYVMRPKIKNSLQDIINAQICSGNGVPDKEKVIKHFYSLVAALESLQNQNIAHQNIKPTNILVDESQRIVFTDISMHRFNKRDRNIGFLQNLQENSLFIAPEVILEN